MRNNILAKDLQHFREMADCQRDRRTFVFFADCPCKYKPFRIEYTLIVTKE